MTFGIDIASSQAGIDLVRAKAEGVEFVVVKMGGLNVAPQYEAPHYRAQVDRAVAAGLPKGHYYLIGRGQTPEAQAGFFVRNLYRFDPAHDVLALDNEALDSNGTRWGDADAARFVRAVLELTGIPASRVWHYAGAGDYRSGSWPQLTALGVRFWWAAYGSYPTGKTPDHEPALQGSSPRWDVHQFTSKSQVAGYALDGNYSPHTVKELFGGVMTLEDQMRQFIAANRSPSDARTWDQMCGSLMFRFNSWRGWVSRPVRDISSAFRAAMGSGWLNTNLSAAPVGAFHFFDIAGPANGHVMQDARGGGLVCLSTGYSLSESLGNAIGFQSVPGYVSAKGARYLGWATNYAGGTISTAGLAGGGYELIEEEDDMKLRAIRNGDGSGSIGLVNDDGTLDGLTGEDYNALVRAGFLEGYADQTDGAVWQILTRRTARIRAQRAGADVDEAAIVKGIAPLLIPAVIEALKGVGSGLSAEQVSAAAEAAVRRVFADAAD